MQPVVFNSFYVASMTSASDTPWWEAASGILGLPGLVIGLYASIRLVKKDRLEAQKLEFELLEMREKRRATVLDADEGVAPPSDLVAGPLLEGRQFQDLVLRFIVFFMAYTLWSLVRNSSAILFDSTVFALRGDMDLDNIPGLIILILDGAPPDLLAIFVFVHAIRAIPEVGFWIIIVGMGLPIFVDAMRTLRFGVPSWLSSVPFQRLAIFVAVIVALLQSIPLFRY